MSVPEWISLTLLGFGFGFGSALPSASRTGIDMQMNDLSAAANRSAQIITDINNESYICTICTDAVTRADIQEFNFWNCGECYNICHFHCAERLHTRFPSNWQCPSCRATQSRLNRECWCGEGEHTCDGLCHRQGNCPHNQPKICRQACHPGPCNIPCSNTCASLPPQATVQSTSWNRFFDRFRRNSTGCGAKMALLCSVFTILCGLEALLVVFWIKWHSEPFNYPFFDGDAEYTVDLFVFLQVPVFMSINIFLIVKIWTRLIEVLWSTLNLDDLQSHPKREKVATISAAFVLVLICCGIVVFPFVGFIGGSHTVWNNMMKDSCKEFNLRINMDAGSKAPIKIRSSTQDIPTREFYSAARLEPAFHSSQPFQYFYRISGSTPRSGYLAVDVDLQNREWRLLKLSDADLETKWLGYSAAHGHELPNFSQISMQLLKNGTFTGVDKNSTHMHIPELDMTIHDMYQFNTSHEHEPFTRVYNTHGLDDNEISAMLEKKWSREPDKREVMRTAAFGHGRGRLDMCIKEYTGWVVDSVFPDPPEPRHVTGIDDRNLVPLAIMWAFRSVKEKGADKF